MTPEQFVSGVQAWTSAIEQSVPFFVVMVTALIMAWDKIHKHDAALNGELEKRIEASAKKVLASHIVVGEGGILHENSNNIIATHSNSNSVSGH